MTFLLDMLLTEHTDQIEWSYLSRNPNAIPLLEQNIDEIIWSALSNTIVLLWKIDLYLHEVTQTIKAK
jgi:hypothetical protein